MDAQNAAGSDVTNEDRIHEIARLRSRLADLRTEKTALDAQAVEHMKSIGRTRERLGNPFFYSGGRHGRPENATQTVTKYTGYKSHEPGLALLFRRASVERDIVTTLDRLRALHANPDR